jgi:hypothetical protein
MQAAFVDDLPDHAPQVFHLHVHIGEVDLPPGLAESARRVAQHGMTVFLGKRIRDVAKAILAATPTVQYDDQRMRTCAWRDDNAHVEERSVDAAREEPAARASAGRVPVALQPRLDGAFARKNTDAVRIGTEILRRLRRGRARTQKLHRPQRQNQYGCAEKPHAGLPL